MSKKPKQKLSSILGNNIYMLGKIAKFIPEYFFLMIAEGVIWGAINSAAALFNYNLLNAVDDGSSFMYAAKIIGVMALFYILAYLFDKWYWHIKNPLMKKKLHLKMHGELFSKARLLDLSCFDDPKFYNDFVWAMNESDARANEVMEDTGKLVNRIVSSFTIFGLLFQIDIVVAIIMFATSIITVVCNLIGNRIGFEHNKEQNPLNRKFDYINRVHHMPDYAKELRTNRASEILLREYDKTTKESMVLDKKYGRKYFVFYGLGWNLLGVLTMLIVTIYLITKLGNGLEVGGFAASMSVIWQVRWLLSDLVERLTKYPKHSLYIEKYLEFMRFEPEITGSVSEIPEFESLEFKNVSFSYKFDSHPEYRFHDENYTPPKTQDGNNVLKNVNLKISKGDKAAIVGYNGAGKTTLIKLIMRLYDVSEGEILYNGINIKEFDPVAYREKIGAVFQDFKIFATSIAENVMNGEYTDAERDTVLKALEAADFSEKLAKLENGIDTHLTREFNDEGTNLSGGESQKIAIARVFAKDYPIIIMDEPSSALDPMAEYNLNRSILDNTESKTVIFISHRLSTTRIADKIYMFDRGELIEEGSHSKLMKQSGKYAEMFNLQAEKYIQANT